MRNGACGADGWTSGGHVVVAAALATLPFSPAGLADGFGEGSLRPAVAGFTPTTGSPAARLLPRARLCGLQVAVYPPAAIIAALARERNPDAPPRTTRKMLAKEILPAHSLTERGLAAVVRRTRRRMISRDSAPDAPSPARCSVRRSMPFMPGVGVEPTRPRGPRILSPLRLPFRHPGDIQKKIAPPGPDRMAPPNESPPSHRADRPSSVTAFIGMPQAIRALRAQASRSARSTRDRCERGRSRARPRPS